MINPLREGKGWSQEAPVEGAKVTDPYIITMLGPGKRKNPSRAILQRLA